LLKGFLIYQQLQSITFDFFKSAIASQEDEKTEANFNSFIALLFECSLRVMGVNFDDSIKQIDAFLDRLKSENFLRLMNEIRKRAVNYYYYTSSLTIDQEAIEIAIRTLEWHPLALKKLAPAMITTMSDVFLEEAIKLEKMYTGPTAASEDSKDVKGRISLLGATLQPKSLVWKLQDSRSEILRRWLGYPKREQENITSVKTSPGFRS
jgi:hypothetical protein